MLLIYSDFVLIVIYLYLSPTYSYSITNVSNLSMSVCSSRGPPAKVALKHEYSFKETESFNIDFEISGGSTSLNCDSFLKSLFNLIRTLVFSTCWLRLLIFPISFLLPIPCSFLSMFIMIFFSRALQLWYEESRLNPGFGQGSIR
ncbi:hypothetical protein FB446DRAFT_760697 [Lentinula raphanica]|nr:hypothetical protein FB446DRAFT_760697 [Lentinula raphanica]